MDGETYYVIRIDGSTFSLAITPGGDAIDLDPAAATGSGHRLFEPDDLTGSLTADGKTTLEATNAGLIVSTSLAGAKTSDTPGKTKT